MINRYPYKGGVWVKLDRPTKEEIKEIMDEYSIDPAVARELTTPTPRPRVELHKSFIYCILHFPAFKHTHAENNNQEIDFIIGKDFVITTQYDTIDALLRLSKILEVDEILSKGVIDHAAGFVFFRIMQEMYKSLFDELAYIDDWTEDIESKIFKGNEREMVVALSKVSRNLLDLKRVTDLHRDVLHSLELAGAKLFGEHFVFHVHAVLSEYYKIHNTIQGSRESVQELRETNDSLLNTKQNEIMKAVTIFAFIVLPFTVVTSLFQMNTIHTPLVGQPNDWAIIVGIEIVVVVILYLIARARKWL